MFKGQKGITLVALVVTIIVLVILAGVSIALILNPDNDLIKTTRSGRDNYLVAANEEYEMIANVTSWAENYIKDSLPSGN